jgi:hypothetical protein
MTPQPSVETLTRAIQTTLAGVHPRVQALVLLLAYRAICKTLKPKKAAAKEQER